MEYVFVMSALSRAAVLGVVEATLGRKLSGPGSSISILTDDVDEGA